MECEDFIRYVESALHCIASWDYAEKIFILTEKVKQKKQEKH